VGDVEIDTEHPLAKYINNYLLFQDGQLIDLAGSVAFGEITDIDSVRKKATGNEIHLEGNGSSNAQPIVVSNSKDLSNGSVYMSGSFDNVVGAGVFFSLRTSDSTPNTLLFRSTDSAVNLRLAGSTVSLTSSKAIFNTTISTNKLITWGGGVRRTLYVDGVQEGTDATAFTWSNRSDDEFILYGDGQAGGNVTDSWQSSAIVFSKELTAGEAKSLQDNPYQILKPKTQPVYWTAGAAPVGTGPKGPFTHPLYGPFRGPIS